MNPVVHFEMPAEDRNRMAKFYENAFGWKVEMMGPEMGDYVVVTTSEADETGRPLERGIINGGFFPKGENTAQVPSVVIAVDNINDSIKDVENAGGKILGEPVDIPGVGKYVSFIDTENNRVSLMQPIMNWDK